MKDIVRYRENPDFGLCSRLECDNIFSVVFNNTSTAIYAAPSAAQAT